MLWKSLFWKDGDVVQIIVLLYCNVHCKSLSILERLQQVTQWKYNRNPVWKILLITTQMSFMSTCTLSLSVGLASFSWSMFDFLLSLWFLYGKYGKHVWILCSCVNYEWHQCCMHFLLCKLYPATLTTNLYKYFIKYYHRFSWYRWHDLRCSGGNDLTRSNRPFWNEFYACVALATDYVLLKK